MTTSNIIYFQYLDFKKNGIFPNCSIAFQDSSNNFIGYAYYTNSDNSNNFNTNSSVILSFLESLNNNYFNGLAISYSYDQNIEVQYTNCAVTFCSGNSNCNVNNLKLYLSTFTPYINNFVIYGKLELTL